MPVASMAPTPPALPDAGAVMGRAGGENFPVALGVLPRRERRCLLAVYGFARLVDELGDELSGDRLAALDWLEAELERAYQGTARHPLLVRLQRALGERSLPREPFLRLIEANRVDQRVARYETWEQLCAYCELSANPVGELVLCVFGLATPNRVAFSDRICTALQLAEHCQDVAEDLRRGRVYMPAADLERFGVEVGELSAAVRARPATSGDGPSGHRQPVKIGGFQPSGEPSNERGEVRARMCELIAFEVGRARGLLDAGAPLLGTIAGRPKLAVAAFLAGGRAALEAIERAGFEVLPGAPRAGRVRRLAALAGVLLERGA